MVKIFVFGIMGANAKCMRRTAAKSESLSPVDTKIEPHQEITY